MKLYEITEKMRAILNSADEEDCNIDQINDDLEQVQIDLDAKLEGCAVVVREIESDSSALDVEIKRLQARKKTIDNNALGLKDYMRHSMESVGIDKVKTALFTISLAKPTKSVAVESVDLLSDNYKRVSISADKAAIKKSLQAGEEVEGASLVESKARLTIK